MLDPYRMVYINFSVFVLLLLFLGLIRNIYRKEIKPIIIVFLLSLLPIVSILRKGVYESGDFTIHIYRTMSFFESLKNFIIMPSWADGLNAGFGYPLFIIINPLPYYLISLFHVMGFSFISSAKIFLIVTYVSSGIFMYIFARKIFRNELAAITSSVLYLFSPYHLTDLHFRVDVGQLLSFSIFPLLCLFFYKSLTEKGYLNLLLLGIILGLFILSHQGIALVSMLFFCFFAFTFLIKNGINKTLNQYKLLFSLLLGLLISSYAWVPYFTHTKFTIMNLSSTFNVSLLSIREVLYSPWRYGFLYQGPNGEISQIVGYVNLLVILLSSLLLITNKINYKYKNQVAFFLLSSVIFIFMTINESKIIWKILPLLENLLVSSRMLFIVVFTTSILAGYLAIYFNWAKKLIYLIIFITISTSILNWGNRRTLSSINDSILTANLGRSTYEGEGYAYLIPKWVGNRNVYVKDSPGNSTKITKGKGNVLNVSKLPQSHEYLVSANSNINVVEYTWYFPGWKLYANKKLIKIDYANKKYPGIVTYSLPKGLWKIELIYEDLWFHKILKIISLVAFISSTSLVFAGFVRNRIALSKFSSKL